MASKNKKWIDFLSEAISRREVADVLIEKYDFRDRFMFNLLGGEPTFMPGLIDLAKDLKRKSDKSLVRIATNGSRALSWWKKAAPYLDVVIVSIHSAQVDIEKLNDNFKVCVENDVILTTNILMDINHWEKSEMILNYMVKKGWSYNIEPKPVETMLGFNKLPVCKHDVCVCGGDLEAAKFKKREHSDAYGKKLTEKDLTQTSAQND